MVLLLIFVVIIDIKLPACSGVSAGSPPFIIQEEFDRYVGFLWQNEGAGGRYWIIVMML